MGLNINFESTLTSSLTDLGSSILCYWTTPSPDLLEILSSPSSSMPQRQTLLAAAGGWKALQRGNGETDGGGRGGSWEEWRRSDSAGTSLSGMNSGLGASRKKSFGWPRMDGIAEDIASQSLNKIRLPKISSDNPQRSSISKKSSSHKTKEPLHQKTKSTGTGCWMRIETYDVSCRHIH